MIYFTSRFDPASNKWQFLIKTEGKPDRWSRPMDHEEMASIGRAEYHKRIAEGKGEAANFYASSIDVKALLASGAFAVTRIPPTSPELLAARRKKEVQELQFLPVDKMYARLGLNVKPNMAEILAELDKKGKRA